MTFLPIVARELRVAARRKSTYRVRRWTAFVAGALSYALVAFVEIMRGVGMGGNLLFSALTYYALGLCLLAGVFITADCLSGEKREGTLGLLFLTDLRGYDVVLGKFVVMSLNAFYGLLAIFPVLAIALPLGGVTGGEFWRFNLALVNALFFSLAAGLWVSARSRDAQKAMGGTLILLAALITVLTVAQAALPGSGQWAGLWFGTAINPLSCFLNAGDVVFVRAPWKFWVSLLLSQLAGWAFLALASHALPRRWQEEAPREARSDRGSLWQRRARPAPRTPATLRLLEEHPILWLMNASPTTRRMAWLMVAIFIGSLVVTLAVPASAREGVLAGVGLYFGRVCGFVLKVLFALQACRFFAEARRTGVLELLFCTPLTNRDLITGQWLALQRAFQWPVLVLFAVRSAAVLAAWGFTAGDAKITQFSFAAVGYPAAAGIAIVAFMAVSTLTDFLALGWLGMWLALVLRNPGQAAGLTILCLLVLPPFVFCVPDVLIDLFFILYCRTKLRRDYRSLITRQ